MAPPRLVPGGNTGAPAGPLTTQGGTTVAQAEAGYAPAQADTLAEQQAQLLQQAAANAQALGNTPQPAATGGFGSPVVGGAGFGQGDVRDTTAPTGTITNPGGETPIPPAGGGLATPPDLTSALPGGGTAAPAGNQLADQTALAQIETTLSLYGFSGAALQQLTQFAWQEILNGVPEEQVALDIQQTPQFDAQFPAIKQRISSGLPPITPAEYISTLDSYTQSLVAAGISPSEVNLNNLVAVDVSPSELSDRIQQGYMVLATAPPDVLNTLQNYYGISSGQLVQWATNPAESEQKILQQVAAAQIGGAAAGSGFMGANAQNGQFPVNAQLATQLAGQGVTYNEAQQGFAQLATQSQLYGQLPGQGQVRGNGGAPFSTSQLAEAQFFGGPAEQALQQQAQREENYFKAGTQVGTSGTQTAAGPFQR